MTGLRFLTLACLAGLTTVVRAEPRYDITVLSSPAGADSSCASFTTAPDGQVWLSWIEPAGKNEHVLKFSTFERRGATWTPARAIAQGADWTVSPADVPALAVQANGTVTAVWSVNNPLPAHAHGGGSAHAQHVAGHYALISQSKDNGVTWSRAVPLTRESNISEFVSLRELPDGTLLAVWLDGRAKASQGPQQLYSRLVGSTQADTLVDARVCDCCPTALTVFPDGSALVAYRGRAPDEIRDIFTARYVDGQWEKTRESTRDGWRINGCPVDGPRVASHGPRVGKVWFTAAYEQPCVLVAMSSDAGGVYTRSMRVDLGRPVGRPDTQVLRDGTQLITWLEQGGIANGSATGGLYLRRYGGSGATHTPTRIAPIAETRSAGYPRIALVKDFDDSPAQFLTAYTRSGEPSRVETLLVTLPAADLLAEADRNCSCTPEGEELVGYPIRAHVLDVTKPGTVRVRHRPVAGVLRAGEREFHVSPEVSASLKPGFEVLARIEERDGKWEMFDVRLLGTPQR